MSNYNILIDWLEGRITIHKQFRIDNCRSQAVESHSVAAFSLFSKSPVQPTPHTFPLIPENTPSSISFISAATFIRTFENSPTSSIFAMRINPQPKSLQLHPLMTQAPISQAKFL
jgi:hypothetical protein